MTLGADAVERKESGGGSCRFDALASSEADLGMHEKVATSHFRERMIRAVISGRMWKASKLMEIKTYLSSPAKGRQGVVATARMLLVALSAACIGCGSGAATSQKRLPVYAVSGTITFNTQPVEGALVSLHPDDQTKPGGFGKTDSAGKFVIRTYSDGSAGAPEGSYILTVQKTANETVAEKKSGADMFKEMEQKAQSGQHWKDAPPTSLIPEKYAKTGSSGIKVIVTQAGVNNETYDLKP